MTTINRPTGCTCSAVYVQPNRSERRRQARAAVLAGPMRVHADTSDDTSDDTSGGAS